MNRADKSDKNHFFKITAVNVDIKNMAIKVKQSNHKLLFGLFKSLALKVLRPVIQKAVEKQVRDNVHKLDGMLFSVKKEADRAAEEAKNNPDPENIENIYQRYFNAFQRELQKGQQKKEKVEAKAADTKVSSTWPDLKSSCCSALTEASDFVSASRGCITRRGF